MSEISAVKLALLAQSGREENQARDYTRYEPIAVVGIGCRFPGGANSPAEYWDLMATGVDAIAEVPGNRWDVDAFYDPANGPGKMTTRWGGFVNQAPDRFDAGFFGISPREADRMDPQQRLVLEVAVEALDDAGQTREQISGSQTGVFIASYHNDYGRWLTADVDAIDAYSSTGTAHSIVANRLSYLLNLQGPSLALDTACSSSLVAVHLACQSLRSGECSVALAGGVSLMLSPEVTISLSKWGFMAADGRCKTFDARADGFVRGEGCGIVVLKRLSDALADSDRILGLVRGSAVNQDGRTTALTAPNGLAQQAVIRTALANARVAPEQVSMIEAHGTGTALGDPIEVEALAQVFGTPRASGEVCLLGSVKTNIGHLEAAAGIAGLIKVILCAQHRAIPPHLHFSKLNPHISLDQTPFAIPTELRPWNPVSGRRMAGVSSFGFGGTNAHVVVEEAPAAVDSESEPAVYRTRYLLPLAAHSRAALDALAHAYRSFLADESVSLADVCYTAGAHRTHYAFRLAVTGETHADLREQLGAVPPPSPERAPRVAFVFSGQGPQWWGMGRELIEREPVFRETIARCEDALRGQASWSLVEELQRDETESRLDDTEIAQPAIFALQVALAALWQSWGIVPDAVVGHSVGEIAAAYVAGVLTLAEAARVVVHRARLMQRATGLGKMVAVEMSLEAAQATIAGMQDRVSIAAINSPGSVTLSGEAGALDRVVAELGARGVLCRALRVNYAFHSPQMEPFSGELADALRGLAPHPARLTLISTVTGTKATATDYDAAYWGRNIRQSVRFADAIARLGEEGCTTFVEISPHPALSHSVSETLAARQHAGLVVASLRRGKPEQATMLTALGALYAHGCNPDWHGVYPAGRIVSLPAYPWQRERHWVDRPAHAVSAGRNAGSGLLGRRVESPAIRETVYENEWSATAPAFLNDHRVFGEVVVPGAAYLSAALELADVHGIDNLAIEDALRIPDKELRTVQFITARENDRRVLQVFSRSGDGWKLHATGTVTGDSAPIAATLDEARARCTDELSPVEFYARLQARGIAFGPRFQTIVQLWRGGQSETVSRARLRDAAAAEADQFKIHPALLDAGLQTLGAALPGDELYLPVFMDRVRIARVPRGEVWCHATLRETGSSETLAGEVRLFDDTGECVAELAGVRVKRAAPAAFAGHSSPGWLYEIAWEPAAMLPRPSEVREGRWLILAGPDSLAERLAERLAADGATCAVIRPGSPLPFDQGWHRVVCLQGWQGALQVVQGLAKQPGPSRVWLVTCGAQPVTTDEVAVEQGAVWGLGRTIMLEHPEMSCTCVDLDPAPGADNSRALYDEIRAGDAERQIAFRNERRYVARLRRSAVRQPAPVQLDIPVRGVLDNLALTTLVRRAPGAGQVEVRIHASGLNFRDVLNALGMYPGNAGPLGSECAGEITAVGEGVSGLQAGDAVLGIALGSLASYAVTRAEFVVRKPAGMAFAQAATTPIAFLTAAHGLLHLARVQPGERVLIHAAAGGVGLAAVQIAHRAGAVVFATAGSDAKRAYLKTLGVEHVMDSRSLAFVDQVRSATQGAGVDIVLNSLADEFIPAGLDALGPAGRFVEIGKRGIWTPDQVAARRPGVTYLPFDLGDVMRQDPAHIQTVLAQVVSGLSAGQLTPLPHRDFALDDAADALRYMALAKHTGKIAITVPAESDAVEVHADATYLITGGTGALGSRVAQWLVARGARNLVLASRHGAAASTREWIEPLERAGARIAVDTVDVSHPEQVERLFENIAATMPALRGIVHAAGIVDDGVLVQQDEERFERVLAAKATSAALLHERTRELPLDFFVLFSSAAAVIGSAGQGNYAAANAYLDALAHQRRACGLPALAIDWGAWGGPGMAAQVGDRWTRQGMEPIAPDRGVQVLEDLLAGNRAQVAVVPVAWSQYLARFAEPPSFYAGLVQTDAPQAVAQTPGQSDLARRLEAAPETKRKAILQAHVRELAIKVLGLRPSQAIDPHQPLGELGLDSLMAVELRNVLATSVRRSLPATLLFDYPTLAGLTEFLDRELAPAQPASAPETETLRRDIQGLEDLTDEQAEALLLAELEQGKRGN